MTRSRQRGGATALTQLALATWLLLGSAGIRRLIYKYRYGDYADIKQ